MNKRNEKYLRALYDMLKRRENFTLTAKKEGFNDTELRLIGEVLTAKKEGKRLISTELATRLGITRSAVSQIVQRLEKQGVVCRLPDAVDRKIAYVEITEEATELYKKEADRCAAFLARVVEKYGKGRFDKLYEELSAFTALLDEEKEALKK